MTTEYILWKCTITYGRMCFPTAKCNIVLGAPGTVKKHSLGFCGKGERDRGRTLISELYSREQAEIQLFHFSASLYVPDNKDHTMYPVGILPTEATDYIITPYITIIMPFPGSFSMVQSTTNWIGSKADTASYACKSYLYFHYPMEQDRNPKDTVGPHVLPPDGSHSWWSRKWFPPLSLVLNLY